ncbi:hypothetical protein GUJ93_ZPchr0008g13213 [Zizania palustris]|uniref:Uncharacterized protein n=1 Tax=Zizania palustris TaxID=103762 RepID=A0A8J5R7V7_ZIZPA|nr:hypothetical protein GUJ93_ZPchr0008g13213 [Zizania palustris]
MMRYTQFYVFELMDSTHYREFQYDAEKCSKRQVMIRLSSIVIIKFLVVMQKHGYIGGSEFVDDHGSGNIVLELNGRQNNCGVRVGVEEIKSWNVRLLPHTSLATSSSLPLPVP